jgi:hypothetical protein
MYHLELRQFPHVARVFNLDREELDRRFVGPWIAGSMIEHDERRWAPERTRLKVLEGPELRLEEMGLGRGWARAAKTSEDVTDAVLAEAERGAKARPELDTLKSAIQEVAGKSIAFEDVMALAAAGHPQWRASEQLALAEQAVWEMLHQERLTMIADGLPVERERWQPIVLSWATWVGGEGDAVRLQAFRSEAPR